MKNAMEGSVGPDAKANGPIAAPSSPVRSAVGPPLAPQVEPQSSMTDVTQMWIKFGKTFALILPIYILGYFEFSFSWVLVGLAALCYWKRNHGGKDYRINRAMAFLEHEDKTATQSLATSELPPWVSPLHSCCYHILVIIGLLSDSYSRFYPSLLFFCFVLFLRTAASVRSRYVWQFDSKEHEAANQIKGSAHVGSVYPCHKTPSNTMTNTPLLTRWDVGLVLLVGGIICVHCS